MAVFMVETYVVKPEKQKELVSLLQRVVKLMKEKPEKFQEVKSYKVYSQMVGAMGGYTEIWEADSMADIEKFYHRMLTDEELMKIPQEFFTLIVPETYITRIWTNVLEHSLKK